MRISKTDIEAIKETHDLRAVVASYGVTLKKKGANYVGLCPFHAEKTPSFTVNPKTHLYHCFGCNAGGDVIGFVTKQEGIGFREAFEKLNGSGNGKRPQQTQAPSSLTAVSASNDVGADGRIDPVQRDAEFLSPKLIKL